MAMRIWLAMGRNKLRERDKDKREQ
jgi:hypothetical protein